MIIKICQVCKNPFKAVNTSLYIKFCSIECADEAYKNRALDTELLNYAARLLSNSLKREREISLESLRELFYLEILKINRLISKKEYEENKKEILGIDDKEK